MPAHHLGELHPAATCDAQGAAEPRRAQRRRQAGLGAPVIFMLEDGAHDLKSPGRENGCFSDSCGSEGLCPP